MILFPRMEIISRLEIEFPNVRSEVVNFNLYAYLAETSCSTLTEDE